jgi:hypothetical protein
VGRGRGGAGRGEVDRPRPAEHADGQVAQGRHDVRAGTGPDLGGVLGEGDIADVVQRLDCPVPLDEVGEPGGVGLDEGQAGDGIDGHRLPPPGAGVQVAGPAGDLDDLGDVGKAEVVDGDGLERPADGGLGRDGEVAGSVGAGAQRGPDRLGRIGGPFGDRGDRPRPGQDRGGRQTQDGDQWVAAATGSSWVGDGGQAGKQVWTVGVLEGLGVGELGQDGWDRG